MNHFLIDIQKQKELRHTHHTNDHKKKHHVISEEGLLKENQIFRLDNVIVTKANFLLCSRVKNQRNATKDIMLLSIRVKSSTFQKITVSTSMTVVCCYQCGEICHQMDRWSLMYGPIYISYFVLILTIGTRSFNSFSSSPKQQLRVDVPWPRYLNTCHLNNGLFQESNVIIRVIRVTQNNIRVQNKPLK